METKTYISYLLTEKNMSKPLDLRTKKIIRKMKSKRFGRNCRGRVVRKKGVEGSRKQKIEVKEGMKMTINLVKEGEDFTNRKWVLQMVHITIGTLVWYEWFLGFFF